MVFDEFHLIGTDEPSQTDKINTRNRLNVGVSDVFKIAARCRYAITFRDGCKWRRDCIVGLSM
jgi:hypothetical protein